jgi:murein DD-endopeptidase MepM/ murein hydrolase activator NlpD
LPKIPTLRLKASFGLWPAKAALLSALVFALSCGHLKTPDYDAQGEFQTPVSEYSTADEYFSSQEVKEFHKSTIRGPFQLYWPVENPIINRGFSRAGKRDHLGLDLKGRKNDPIYAAHDGIVVYVGKKFRGYGKMVLIEYDNNWASLYSHLNSYKVVMGQEVKGGQLIGKMGRTGRATGVHLHFELIKNKKPIDPLPLLKESAIIRNVARE